MKADEVKKLAREHIIHSWSVNAGIDPPVIAGVDGVHVIDPDGGKILDFHLN